MSIDEYREFDPIIFNDIRYLLNGQPTAPSYRNNDALNFLLHLGYRAAADGTVYKAGASSHLDDEKKLLALAAKLARFFVVRPPQSPGLMFCAGAVDSPLNENDSTATATVSVGGIGSSFAASFRRCLGEAAEYLSQIDNADESPAKFHSLPLDESLGSVSQQGLSPFVKQGLSSLDCLQAECFNDSSDVYIPADLCVRRQIEQTQIDVPYKISSGLRGRADTPGCLVQGDYRSCRARLRGAVVVWRSSAARNLSKSTFSIWDSSIARALQRALSQPENRVSRHQL